LTIIEIYYIFQVRIECKAIISALEITIAFSPKIMIEADVNNGNESAMWNWITQTS